MPSLRGPRFRAHHAGAALLAAAPGLLAAPAAAVPQQTADTKLLAADLIAGSHSGEAVDLDGDTMAVGVPDHYTPADAPGRVAVFLRDASGWSEHGQLFPSDGHLGDEFGAALSLDGDTLLVGAPSRDGATGEFEGAAYVFTRDGAGAWTQQQKLLPPVVEPSIRFGEEVALGGGHAVVLTNSTTSSGFRVFPFARDQQGAWMPEPPLDPPVLAHEVELAGARLVVAGLLPDERPAAAVYERSAGAWVLETTLAGDQSALVTHLAFDGQTVALSGISFLGSAVHVFRRQDAGGWTEQAVVPPDTEGLAALGASMAVAGDRLILGLLNNGTDSFDSVRVLGLDDEETWREQLMLVPPGYPIDDGFGFDLAVEDATLAVGAPEDDEAGNSAGAVFTGQLAAGCPWDLDGDGAVGILDLLALLSQWGDAPVGPPDFDGDGTVGITDFLALLANWGPCP